MLDHDLDRLLEDLELTGADPTDALLRLQEALASAVPSYTACRVSIVVDSVVVTLTQTRDGDVLERAASTLMVPLVWLEQRRRPGEITFYANAPGAWVDLGAELAYAFELGLDEIEIDTHFDTLPLRAGMTGLDELSVLNRAVGMLIGQGVRPSDALPTLRARADAAGTLMITEAQRLLGRR